MPNKSNVILLLSLQSNYTKLFFKKADSLKTYFISYISDENLYNDFNFKNQRL